MSNSIHNLDTKYFEGQSGSFPGIVMGLNIHDMSAADIFLDHVIQQFKNQRMCSPPETAHMTITIMGKMTAAQFRDMWLERADSDPILKQFTSSMVLADVLHIQGRELLDRTSLVQSPH